MAPGTVGRVLARRKLCRVGIDVAAGTLLRSGAEVNIFQVCFHRRGAMAVSAGYATVGPAQGEVRFRMVKAVERLPVCSGVAGFTTDSCAARKLPFHLFAELPLVGIHVTTRTGTVVKMIFHG